jgi:amino acid permease
MKYLRKVSLIEGILATVIYLVVGLYVFYHSKFDIDR